MATRRDPRPPRKSGRSPQQTDAPFSEAHIRGLLQAVEANGLVDEIAERITHLLG